MAGITELRLRLTAATDIFSRTTDPIERSFLGADIRELEKLCEIALRPENDLAASGVSKKSRGITCCGHSSSGEEE